MRPFFGVISRGHNTPRSTAHPAAARRRAREASMASSRPTFAAAASS